MALTYSNTFAKGFNARTYTHFIYKRLGRIYPLYLVVTLCSLIAGFSHQAEIITNWPLTIFCNALMISGWGFALTITIAAWSVSAELAAYLLFPFLSRLTLKSRSLVGFTVFGVCIGLIIFLATRSDVTLAEINIDDRHGSLDISKYGTPFPLLRCIAEFTLGLLAFRLSNSHRIDAVIRGWMADLIAIAILGLLAFAWSDIVEVLLFPILIISLTKNTGITARVMRSRFVYWLGLISYSIYLAHVLVKDILRNWIIDILNSAHAPHAYTLSNFIMAGLTLKIAELTYRLIEQPARNWSRRMVHEHITPIESEPSAP